MVVGVIVAEGFVTVLGLKNVVPVVVVVMVWLTIGLMTRVAVTVGVTVDVL